jgi:hypothetical protein
VEHLASDLLFHLQPQVSQVDRQVLEGVALAVEHAVLVADLEELQREDVSGALDIERVHQHRRGDAPPAPGPYARARGAQRLRRDLLQDGHQRERRLPRTISGTGRLSVEHDREQRIAVHSAEIFHGGREGAFVLGLQLHGGILARSISSGSRATARRVR